MRYRSLLAHVVLGHDNANIHAVSRQLAGLFDARVIGIAAARLSPPFTEVPIAETLEYERESAEAALKLLESDFHTAFRGHNIALSWRAQCDYAPIGDYLARQARAADLVITSPQSAGLLARLEETHLGPLVLSAGRPVLVVPQTCRLLDLRKAVVAWKDTREARRAAADALPLLAKAQDVLVVEACARDDVAAAQERTADVVQWLKTHGISARSMAIPHIGSDLDGLYGVLAQEKCDLLVAGAYGHTRLREWVFGGVTMDLLMRGEQCVLLSH